MVQMKVSTVSVVCKTFALTLLYMHTQVLVPLALIVLLFRRGMVQIWYECIYFEIVFCFVPLNFSKMQEFEGEYDIPDKYTGRYEHIFNTSKNRFCVLFMSFTRQSRAHRAAREIRIRRRPMAHGRLGQLNNRLLMM